VSIVDIKQLLKLDKNCTLFVRVSIYISLHPNIHCVNTHPGGGHYCHYYYYYYY